MTSKTNLEKSPLITPEEAEQLASVNMSVFNEVYGIKTEVGRKLDFKKHLFLFDIYNDFSSLQVIYKAAQIGFSTLAIIKSLWLAKNKVMDIIYTLPTQGDVTDFVGGKINRIIAQNPKLLEYVKDRDTIEQKRVGDNVIYYRGTWTEKAALMVSSDLNIYDEEDRSNQKVIDQYASRLQHSQYKWEWHFSNPSAEGNGVSRYWEVSDQKHWFIRCHHCKKKQFLSWPESINVEERIFVCKHCHKELSDEDRRVGEWVAKYKFGESMIDNNGKPAKRVFSGYWISLLMAPWVKAGEIVDAYNTKDKEYFYNFILGLPYVGSGNKVTFDIIKRNFTNDINDQTDRIIIGVDPGAIIRYVCGNKQGLFYYGECNDYDEIEKLMKRWPTSIVVTDGLGDIIGPRKLREKYPGRVFLCFYGADRKTMQLIRWGKKKEEGNVIADRNRMIQMVIDEFSDKRIPLQGGKEEWWNYWLHWQNIYRIETETALGTKKYQWNRSGRDDWVHATIYWRIGMERFGKGIGELINRGSINLPSAPEISPEGTITGRTIKPKIISKEPDWRDI